MAATVVRIPHRGMYERIFGQENFNNIADLCADFEADIGNLEGWRARGFQTYFNVPGDGSAATLIPGQEQYFALNYRRFADRITEVERKAKKITAYIDSAVTKLPRISARSEALIQRFNALNSFKANNLTPYWTSLTCAPYQELWITSALRYCLVAPIKATYDFVTSKTRSRIAGIVLTAFGTYESYNFISTAYQNDLFSGAITNGLYYGARSVGLHSIVLLGLGYVFSKAIGR